MVYFTHRQLHRLAWQRYAVVVYRIIEFQNDYIGKLHTTKVFKLIGVKEVPLLDMLKSMTDFVDMRCQWIYYVVRPSKMYWI